jgi:phosphoenolpyruvate carboxykinase (ATP)
MGVTEPIPSFSPCFGGPFLVWHPTKYAELLAERIKKHDANVWLVNTGWSGGPYGVGKRMSIKHTRAIIDAIHSGTLKDAPTVEDPVFGLHVPTEVEGVPAEVLIPRNTWSDKDAFDATAKKLAGLFRDNFKAYEARASDEIIGGGPKL